MYRVCGAIDLNGLREAALIIVFCNKHLYLLVGQEADQIEGKMESEK